MAIPFLFDVGPLQGAFVYSGDPAVEAATTPEQRQAYIASGDMADLGGRPAGATVFHLEPVPAGPVQLLTASALQRVPGEALEWSRRIATARGEEGAQRRLTEAGAYEKAMPAVHALERVKVEVVALALRRVEGWTVPPEKYGDVLRAMVRQSPKLGFALVAELYDRVVQVSELGPEGK